MKVFIENKGGGVAMGRNITKDRVLIKNGDLISQDTTEITGIEKKDNLIIGEIFETYRNEDTIKLNSDRDGLISTKNIKPIGIGRAFSLSDKWVFPHGRVHRIMDYIINIPHLWEKSKFAFIPDRSIYAAARHFGISFQTAMEKIGKSGFVKSRLYCENKSDFSTEGVVAEMLANVYAENEELVCIEIWQGVEDVEEVFYSHGYINVKDRKFTHFDCAMIKYDITDKEKLFKSNRKIKSGDYLKLFRVDGCIDEKEIFEIANRFFPLDNLIDEYFSIEEL